MDRGCTAQCRGHSGTTPGTDPGRLRVCPVVLRATVNKGSFPFNGALECASRSLCIVGVSLGRGPEPIPVGIALVRARRVAQRLKDHLCSIPRSKCPKMRSVRVAGPKSRRQDPDPARNRSICAFMSISNIFGPFVQSRVNAHPKWVRGCVADPQTPPVERSDQNDFSKNFTSPASPSTLP